MYSRFLNLPVILPTDFGMQQTWSWAMRMFKLVEWGGRQCFFFTSIIFHQMYVYFCFYFLLHCMEWHRDNSQIPICFTYFSPEQFAKAFYNFGSKDCMKLSGLDGKTESSIMSAARETYPHYSNSSSTMVLPFSSYQIPPCHPFLTPTSLLHLTSSKIKRYSTLQQ